jgi:hypothetical protein
MSRPYLRIDNVSYSTASNVLSVSLQASRIRGYDNENDIIIEGFSQSKTIPVSNGFFQGSVTYSVPNLETSTASISPTTTFVAPSVSLIISGSLETSWSGNSFFSCSLKSIFNKLTSSTVTNLLCFIVDFIKNKKDIKKT